MLIIGIHAVLASLALFLGARQLASKKGTRQHKVIGWIWVVMMVVVSLSSFEIRELNPDGTMSWIHVLSIVTLASLVIALLAIKNGRRSLHQHVMIGTFLGLVIAGAFTLMPGRLLHTMSATIVGNGS